MSEDLIVKKETMKKNLEDLINSVNQLEPSQSIKVYQNLLATVREELEKIEHPTENCISCGSPLESWEKERCGPCKIADERVPEEED
ncbi:MAG: hypothetical protein R3237_00045 [Nitrosopumilaceae archaeon]|nr:hypothetical protein [Nitrosopumilaceae archaeon]